MARRSSERRVIAYQQNGVFPWSHKSIHFSVCFPGGRGAATTSQLTIQQAKDFFGEFLDAEGFRDVRNEVAFQKFLGLLGDHVAGHEKEFFFQRILGARQRLEKCWPSSPGSFMSQI